MHDMRAIRENAAAYDANWARRGLEEQTPEILRLDATVRAALTELQTLQAERKTKSKEIGKIKAQGGDADAVMAEVAGLKARMAELEGAERDAKDALQEILEALPNLMDDDVPGGADEEDNREVSRWGEAGKEGPDHVEIGEALGFMDFEAAAKISGARFVVLKGALARLERALAAFMLDMAVNDHGYTEVSPPLLVNDGALFGTGQLPKFDNGFVTTDGHYLIPTSEVPLTNLVREAITATEDLPLRYTAYTPCFRSEAGSAGKDTRGMLRQHQFYKVEMVGITRPEDGPAEHARMRGCAENVLKALGLPFRTVVLCTGDTGFCARKTYDLEVWLPGQGRYREISSVSHCGDFQARRMNARCRAKGEKQTRFVHTLNGSGVAVGRALIAVLETYWDGARVVLPEVLHPYMGGAKTIEAA